MSRDAAVRRLPALDGIRGVLVIFLLTYHFGVGELRGAWLTLNVFFALSGFLIVRVLVAERAATGRIRFGAFYARRARRLFPALGGLLAAVLVWGFLFAPDQVRGALRWDVLATMGYFMNWRLIAQSNEYFVQFTQPSVLQHTWSLSVEEQFYLIAPVLVLGLTTWLRSRRALVAVLFALAVGSALWMAYVGVGSATARSHGYYGTDTRAQSLLVGAALGAWLAPRADGRTTRPPAKRTVQAAGWSALAISLAGFVLAQPQTEEMARGGMFLLSLAAIAWIWAAADERAGAFQRALSVWPLAALGRISYGCYLWHWPIGLWLAQAMPREGAPVRVVLGFVLTIGVAVLSYQRLEMPVRRHGLRAVAGRLRAARSVALGCVAALAAGAAGVGAGAPDAVGVPATHAPTRVVPLVAGQPAYKKPAKPVSVAVYGDSVPYLLHKSLPAGTFPGVVTRSVAVPGCDLLDQPWMNPQDNTAPANPAECTRFKRVMPARIAAADSDVMVIFPSVLLGFPHKFATGARWWDDPEYTRTVTAQLDTVRAAATAAGTRPAIVTQTCRTDDTIGFRPLVDAVRAKQPPVYAELRSSARTNAFLRQWAASRKVQLIDLHRAVCPSGVPRTIEGMPVFGDGIHFSPQFTPSVWAFLLAQLGVGR